MCIDLESLEFYLLGCLPEPEAEAVEEHLLLCEICQDRCDGQRVGVEALQTALKEHTATASGKLTPISGTKATRQSRLDRGV
jgi:hypothetical protein